MYHYNDNPFLEVRRNLNRQGCEILGMIHRLLKELEAAKMGVDSKGNYDVNWTYKVKALYKFLAGYAFLSLLYFVGRWGLVRWYGIESLRLGDSMILLVGMLLITSIASIHLIEIRHPRIPRKYHDLEDETRGQIRAILAANSDFLPALEILSLSNNSAAKILYQWRSIGLIHTPTNEEALHTG